MIFALLAATLVPVIPTVRANNWNFVEVRPEQFLATEIGKDSRRLQVWVQGNAFTELIPSWNVALPPRSGLSVQIQPEGAAKPFELGNWNFDSRASVKAPKSPDGQVNTDTLVLAKSTEKVLITLNLRGSGGEFPKVHRFYAVLTSKPSKPVAAQPREPIALDVPMRSQMDYPGGSVLCSPTSVSMLLAYWSTELGDSSLDHDVPQVQKEVYDPIYRGTGNWSFNASYAGSLPGMKGYVSRLRSVADIEAWIESGVPVIASVNYGLLQGKAKDSGGHLVVIVGFDSQGQPIFNDPGRKVVRMNYRRKNFERAWAVSGNTVYLIYPQGWEIPSDGPWAAPETTE